jgi:hypothetical protein
MAMLFLGFFLMAAPIDRPLVFVRATAPESLVASPIETPNLILNINSNDAVM